MVIHVYTEVGWGNSLQTILKYLSKMVYLQYFLSFHANTCLYLLRQSAWAGSLHANIVQRVNMTHLLRNHPWFFHQSSCVECWFARQLSSSSIYWFFFHWCEGMTTDQITKQHTGSFHKPDCIINQMAMVLQPSALLFWPKILIGQ